MLPGSIKHSTCNFFIFKSAKNSARYFSGQIHVQSGRHMNRLLKVHAGLIGIATIDNVNAKQIFLLDANCHVCLAILRDSEIKLINILAFLQVSSTLHNAIDPIKTAILMNMLVLR